MQESIQIIMKSLEAMDTWKVLVIGFLFLWAVKIVLGIFATGFAYFATPWHKMIKHGPQGNTIDVSADNARMPVSIRILGSAMTFLFVGLAVVLCAVLPLVSPWVAVGIVLAALGAGLLVFYGLVSKEEKRAGKEFR
jgi:membrane protein implicated in regulation of membrane protease activity